MFLEPKLNYQVVSTSLLTSLILAEAAYIFSFWPINSTILALFLTTAFYALVGILQQKLIDRLFANTLREFLLVVLVTFILLILTTSWGG